MATETIIFKFETKENVSKAFKNIKNQLNGTIKAVNRFNGSLKKAFSGDFARNLNSYNAQFSRFRNETQKMAGEFSKLATQLKNTNKALRLTATGLKQANQATKRATNATKKHNKSLLRQIPIFRGLTSAFRAYLAIQAVGHIVELADSWTRAGTAVKLVSGEYQSLSTIQNQLFELSQRVRVSFEDTLVIYRRIGLRAKDLGITQKRLLGITETIQKAIKITGTTSDEARGGIIQLSQALGSGALRGDELRSVMEQMPIIAEAIAKEFGVGIGQLKDLGKEGKLVTDRVLKAIESAAPEINKQFKDVQKLGTDAFTIIGNEFKKFLGEINQSLGASKGLNAFAEFLRQDFPKAVSIAVGAIVGLLLPAMAKWIASLTLAQIKTALATAGLSVLAGTIATFIAESQIDKLIRSQEQLNLEFDNTGKALKSTQDILKNVSYEKLRVSINSITEELKELREFESKSSGFYGGYAVKIENPRIAELEKNLGEQQKRAFEVQLQSLKEFASKFKNITKENFSSLFSLVTNTSKKLFSVQLSDLTKIAEASAFSIKDATDEQLKDIQNFYKEINKFPERYFQAFTEATRRSLASNFQFQQLTQEQQDATIDKLLDSERLVRLVTEQTSKYVLKARKELEKIAPKDLTPGKISFDVTPVDPVTLVNLEVQFGKLNKEIRKSRTYIDEIGDGWNSVQSAIGAGVLDFRTQWSDTWNGIRDLTKNVFEELTENLIKFAETGKFAWSDLFQSILSGVIRISSNKLISELLGGLTNLFTSAGTGTPGGGFSPSTPLVPNPIGAGAGGASFGGGSAFGFNPSVSPSVPSPSVQQSAPVVNVIVVRSDEEAQQIVRQGKDEVYKVIAESSDLIKNLALG